MNKQIEILVVDDEPKILEVIKPYLENSGYIVSCSSKGTDAMEIFKTHDIDLIILDLMLPDISGEEICKAIRLKSRVPIIMLSAKAFEENILDGLNIGADDYIIKPFSPKQLVARVNAILRRTSSDDTIMSEVLSFNEGDLIIDNIKHEVRKSSEILNLTPNEYKFLITLAKNPTKVFARDELIVRIMGDNFLGFDRAIDTHIKNLRRKIEDDTKDPTYILTVYGFGYKFGGRS